MGIKRLSATILGLSGVFITLKVLGYVGKVVAEEQMKTLVVEIQRELDKSKPMKG